ncbi:MAG: pseudouridine synthase [Ignavibacteria bacterium]|nr:pseudouridine synthase [Ignavibacteria bacterium]
MYGFELMGKTKKDSSLQNEIRLNKYLASTGISSRRKADDLIKSGVVKVNQKTVSELGVKISLSDFVTVNGDPVGLPQTYIYILLNKPKDVITTTSDEKNRKTVLDIVRKKVRIYPVGRLDRNTTGVLLLTNDGELSNRLTHPKYKIERIYNVLLEKELTNVVATQIAAGVELEDGRTSPCELFIHPENRAKIMLKLHEGRHHEVKRIFEHFEYEVKQLERKSFAGVTCSGLPRGVYRHLLKAEVRALKKLVGIST